MMKQGRFLVLKFLCLQIQLSFEESIKVFQPRILEANRYGEATLVCGYNCTTHTVGVELKVTIKTSQEEVCNATYNSTTKPFESRARFLCLIQPGECNVTVTINHFGLSAIDYYVCKLEKVHPPPYNSGVGSGTLIYISGEGNIHSEALDLKYSFILVTSLLAAVAFFFLLYSIAITFVHFHSKREPEAVTEQDHNSVYERMAPTMNGEQIRGNTKTPTHVSSHHRLA